MTFSNCSASASRPERAQRDLGLLAVDRRRLADLAGGDLEVLLAERRRPRRRPSCSRAASLSGSSQIRML